MKNWRALIVVLLLAVFVSTAALGIMYLYAAKTVNIEFVTIKGPDEFTYKQVKYADQGELIGKLVADNNKLKFSQFLLINNSGDLAVAAALRNAMKEAGLPASGGEPGKVFRAVKKIEPSQKPVMAVVVIQPSGGFKYADKVYQDQAALIAALLSDYREGKFNKLFLFQATGDKSLAFKLRDACTGEGLPDPIMIWPG